MDFPVDIWLFWMCFIKDITNLKPTTVSGQLTKSRDFRQNYLCDFHLQCHETFAKIISVTSISMDSSKLLQVGIDIMQPVPDFCMLFLQRLQPIFWLLPL